MIRRPASRPLWRDHLTFEERRIVADAEAARDKWRRLKHVRADIAAKASQRAREAREREE